MPNPLLTPDGKHPQLGDTAIPPKPPGIDAATDDFATVPQPFGRTLTAGPDLDSFVDQGD